MNKRLLYSVVLLLGTTLNVLGQIVSISPSNPQPDEEVTLTFDASEGDGQLQGASQIYAHLGVVIDKPASTKWSNVVGNWGVDDGVGEMKPVAGKTDVWELKLTPSLRSYFKVNASDPIFRISAVFRSADGSKKGTLPSGTYGWGEVDSKGDYYIDLNGGGSYVLFDTPTKSEVYLSANEKVPFQISTSSTASLITLYIDEGNGLVEVAKTTTDAKILKYDYSPTASQKIKAKAVAVIGGSTLERTAEFVITKVGTPQTKALPTGMQLGINYDAADDTKVTLVLEAPNKGYVYAIGDFSDWIPKDEYLMNKTPDGEKFWIEISGLEAKKEYVYQYWIDGEIKVGDPYAEKVSDPNNDKFIPASVYPNLPSNTRAENGLATVFQTGQTAFVWDDTEKDWVRPDLDHIVIYELLIRDFLGSHSWKDLTDTLSYLKRLGVDAIEVMPFNEFEGNESWGYNPSYFFAPDKYYGTKDDIKRFVQKAHQMGFAVIMDVVLNHAFGQNPMLRMYFDSKENKPATDNPWFNREYVGQYQWGYDFDHESKYTQAFVDRFNSHWLSEYHLDGYRFDFTKGLTNSAPGGSVDGFDQSRIDLIKRMVAELRKTDPDAYVILEHWAPAREEEILAQDGMKMWRNRSYDYVPAVIGNPSTGNFNQMDITSHVSYFDSHDERRIAEHALTEGLKNNDGYDIKKPLIMYERAKLAAAFTFLLPGPKMMWQFDELGYDIDINLNGRVGNKPLPWGKDGLGYYEDPLRQNIYSVYQGLLDIRKKIDPKTWAGSTTNHKLTGATRRLQYKHPNPTKTDMVVIGNFGLTTENISPEFSKTGKWYDYFSGEERDVTNTSESISLEPGEWHVFTTTKLSDGVDGAVGVYKSPVTVSPADFTMDDEITITFDATLATRAGTDGLVGVDKVYIHAGVTTSPTDHTLRNVVGTLQDDGVGEMTKTADDKWQITLTPKTYFSLSDDADYYNIGMYFRDAQNVKLGKGFREQNVLLPIISSTPIITIEPAKFNIDDEITIAFNANRGKGGLKGESSVYMHSSIDITNSEKPYETGWRYAVGNWGNDDGVGKMSPVSGKANYWQIKLVPETYYNLPDGSDAYWLSAVFRSADGSKKGESPAGKMVNGFVHSNLDYFIENQKFIKVEKENEKINLSKQTVVEGDAGREIGTLSVVDETKPFTYSIVIPRNANSDICNAFVNSFFEIDGQKLKSAKPLVYYEGDDLNTYTLWIEAKTTSGEPTYKKFEIEVTAASGKAKRELNQLRIHPNPASESTTLTIATDYRGEISITLYNLMGGALRGETISKKGDVLSHEIDLSGLPRGVYLLRVESGNDAESIRLIKQ